MRTTICLPCCLLLACVWPLQAQQTTVKYKALTNEKSTSQKEQGTQTTDRVLTARAEKELIQLEKQWAEAGVKGDVGFFERIAAADYLIVDCDGSVRNKQQEIANSRPEAQTSQSVEDLNVRVYERSAVVVGKFTITGTYAGQPNNLSGNFTDVWIRRNRTWQLVSTQNTCKAAEGAQTGNPPDTFFIAKEKEVWEALKHKDKPAATRLIADDFVGVYDFGFFNKSEWVNQLDDQYTAEDYTIENAKLLRPSANAALLLYTSNCKGTGTWAEDCFHTSRISDLWVDRNGQWLSLFSQDTQATSGESDDAVLNAILSSERQIVDALSRNDIETFVRLLPDDVVDIDTDGVHRNPEWSRGFEQQKKDGLLFRDFRFEDPKLVRLGPDQAILTAREIIHGLNKGKPFEDRFYTMSCYVRRNGKWVPRVYQDTPIQ
jgi:ketosteroid isomerase-like protein